MRDSRGEEGSDKSFPLVGRGREGTREQSGAIACVRVRMHLSVRVFCSLFGFRRKPSKECVSCMQLFLTSKSRVSLCVCLELRAQLTQHLDIGTVPPWRSAVSAGSLSSLFL